MYENNKNLEAALEYLAAGWSVIPTGLDKRPLLAWKEFQTKRATAPEVREWFAKWPEANIGIVTGKISGLVVVDVEQGGSTEGLTPTVISATGGGGYHYYYKHPGFEIGNDSRKIRELTDIRGDGGFVVAPFSRHASGKFYEWIASPDMADLADLPEWILKIKKQPTKIQINLKDEVTEGARNQTAAQVAGKLLFELPKDRWESDGWAMFKHWNEMKCKPPLDEAELRNTWESIKARESENLERDGMMGEPKKRSQADLMVELLEANDAALLFHNEHKDPYLYIPVEDHFEVWQCRSNQLKRWLARQFWITHAKAPNPQAMRSAMNVIEAKSCFDGPMMKLHNRVAWHEGAIWVDLTDATWRAVKITSDGWTVEARPPILFERFNNQIPQVVPQHGGSLKEFLKLVNITNDDQKILLLVWMVSCFIPDFPHPIPSFYGAHGSAKSWVCRLLQFLIDPSSSDLLTMPSKEKEDDWALVISKHWLTIFDNLSNIPGKISDLLCKAVTGGGFETRELYTNSDSVIFTFKHCMVLNSLSLVAVKPDLLDRSLLFKMDRAQTGRKDEAVIMAEFNRLRPYILGDIFTVVSQAMKIKANIKIKELPRMADFAIWGAAIAQVLGYGQEAFLAAYARNINIQNEEVLKDSLVGTVVRHFMETRDSWKETASETLVAFTETAKKLGINVEQEREWPKAANSLSRKLNELKTNLAQDGIRIDTDQNIGKSRAILITKVRENIVVTAESVQSEIDKAGAGDDASTILQSELKFVSSPVTPLKQAVQNDVDDIDGISAHPEDPDLERVRQVFPGAEIVKDDDDQD